MTVIHFEHELCLTLDWEVISPSTWWLTALFICDAAPITRSPNIRHPFMWRFYCTTVLHVSLTVSFRMHSTQTNPRSCRSLHNLQNTQKNGYLLYIQYSFPPLSSPNCPVTFLLWVASPIQQQRHVTRVLLNSIQYLLAAIIGNNCLHNNPVSYDQIK